MGRGERPASRGPYSTSRDAVPAAVVRTEGVLASGPVEAGLAVAGALVAQPAVLAALSARPLRAVDVRPARVAHAHEAERLRARAVATEGSIEYVGPAQGQPSFEPGPKPSHEPSPEPSTKTSQRGELSPEPSRARSSTEP